MFQIESYKEMYMNQLEELRNLIHLVEENHTTDLLWELRHAPHLCDLRSQTDPVLEQSSELGPSQGPAHGHEKCAEEDVEVFLSRAIDCNLRRLLHDLSLPDSFWEWRVAAEDLLVSAVGLYSAMEDKGVTRMSLIANTMHRSPN
ncbi:hypothetical protein CRENBAI_017651 [Crenichthys baileyi]|uniref:Uncharacterized protein n=1 Tax=Crenichthys baileyi TaxID=28760 RepID=A0AAV9RQR4_9TELE